MAGGRASYVERQSVAGVRSTSLGESWQAQVAWSGSWTSDLTIVTPSKGLSGVRLVQLPADDCWSDWHEIAELHGKEVAEK